MLISELRSGFTRVKQLELAQGKRELLHDSTVKVIGIDHYDI